MQHLHNAMQLWRAGGHRPWGIRVFAQKYTVAGATRARVDRCLSAHIILSRGFAINKHGTELSWGLQRISYLRRGREASHRLQSLG